MAVLLAICLAYANSFQNGFHFDDSHTIVDNPAIRSLHNVPRFFTDATTFSVLPANRTYRPLVSTSLAIDYALGRGYVPFWFHFSTFALFLGLVLLLNALYRLLLDKTLPSPKNEWLALFAASWFGLHPAMAETVNYIIQRGDLYCTLGCVAALFLFARYVRLRSTGLYLVPFTFALFSKPPAAVFPVLLLLYVFFFETPDESAFHRLRRGMTAAVPSVAVTAALLWLQSAMTPKSFLPSILSPWSYRLTQPFVWLRYIAEFFLPLHLNVDTDLAPFSNLDQRAAAGLLFLAALFAAIWMTSRRRRLYPIAFGLLWFVVTQLPTSLYPLSEAENDHRMFFSFVGLILAAVWAAWILFERFVPLESRTKFRPSLVPIAIVFLCGYAYGVNRRNAVWRTEESLWHDDVEKSPRNGRGLMNYGLTQMSKGAYATALDYFSRALVFTPNYPSLEINLGIVNGELADQGDTPRSAEAERHFVRAIALSPADDTTHAYYGLWLEQHGRSAESVAQLRTAIALDPQRLLQHELLIEAFTRIGDLDGARQAAQETLVVVPDNAAALRTLSHPPVQDAAFWINLSLDQYKQAQYPQAINSARHALQLDPNSAEAYTNIGAGYGAMQRWDEAIRNEREALRLKPDLQLARNNLNWYLGQSAAVRAGSSVNAALPAKPGAEDFINESLHLNQAGRYAESIRAAHKALQLNPNSAEAWNNIAADNGSLHRWDDAIAAAQRAISLKPGYQLAKNNLAWSLAQKAAGK
ncbi:MAG: protein O-mannosyl-transferase [Acidobacteriaceae bacterium]|nr:protein O-mannosyl-transferase [Acidobacteriaceae bacterium]